MPVYRPTPGGWITDTVSGISRASPGGSYQEKTDAAASGEVAATPLQNTDNGFGPALAARINGVIQ